MNIDMIHAAGGRLEGYVRRTPLLSSPFIDEMAGRRVLIKAECLQHTGSFKYRGARSAISALSNQDRRAGVFAYSSGNHAQGIALAARQHDVPAVIVMPSDVPDIKLANTRAYGAEVVFYDRASESREEIGAQIAAERDLVIIKPFDDPQVIAGQGTIGLEMAQQAREHGVSEGDVLVCCGGGGMTSGIALALAEHAPGFQVRPVEPANFDDVTRSLASGSIEQNATTSGTICDAIATQAPGALTFPILKRLCGQGIVVSDDECLKAMAVAWERLKIVVEPGGAVALAAVLFHRATIQSDTVICVASGGNVDPAMFARALETI